MWCIGGIPIMTSLIAGGVAGGGGLPAGEEGSNGKQTCVWKVCVWYGMVCT